MKFKLRPASSLGYFKEPSLRFYVDVMVPRNLGGRLNKISLYIFFVQLPSKKRDSDTLT